jgi:hypothetical protein
MSGLLKNSEGHRGNTVSSRAVEGTVCGSAMQAEPPTWFVFTDTLWLAITRQSAGVPEFKRHVSFTVSFPVVCDGMMFWIVIWVTFSQHGNWFSGGVCNNVWPLLFTVVFDGVSTTSLFDVAVKV